MHASVMSSNGSGTSTAQSSESTSPTVQHYDKLVVPLSMRSIYWKFFGFPATSDSQIITRSHIICSICHHQIVYNRNTSNLRMHLQAHHTVQLNELELENKTYVDEGSPSTTDMDVNKPGTSSSTRTRSNKRARMSEMSDFESDTEKPVTPSAMVRAIKQETGITEDGETVWTRATLSVDSGVDDVNTATREFSTGMSHFFAEMLAHELLPPETFSGKAFGYFMMAVAPSFEIPTVTQVNHEILPTLYSAVKEELQALLKDDLGSDIVSLTVETWGEEYLSVSASRVIMGSYKTYMLQTTQCASWSVDEYKNCFEDLAKDWQFNSATVPVVVATSNENLLKFLKCGGRTVIPCLAFVLQDLVSRDCFSAGVVNETLDKCRTLVAHLAGTLVHEEYVIDCPGVWITTYHMLEKLNENKATFDVDVDWSVVEDLLAILKPLYVTVKTLREERNPCASLLKPLMSQLEKVHLRHLPEDSELAIVMKALLTRHLRETYSKEQSHMPLEAATFLDPRFKSTLHDIISKEQVSKYLKKVVANSTDNKSDVQASSNPVLMSMVPADGESSSKLGMQFLLGGLCETKSASPVKTIKEKIEIELAQYMIEEGAPLTECPLAWWHTNRSKCPNLAKLALKFVGLPPIAWPVRHQAITADTFYRRRKVMGNTDNSSYVDQMFFLHHNMQHSKYGKFQDQFDRVDIADDVLHK